MADFKSIYNIEYVQALGAHLHTLDSGIDVAEFVAHASEGLLDLEMKPRARHITDTMHAHFRGDIPTNIAALCRGLADFPVQEDDTWHGFRIWPWTMYVATYGIDFPDESLDALYLMTMRFTAEFAIQPFIEHHKEKTFERLNQWVQDDNVHLRRLVSEGTRTRLPWGKKMTAVLTDLEPVLALLEQLKDDSEDYVQRSVANNLNDLSKDQPALMLDVVERWHQTQPTPARTWIIKHALRTLIKKGEPRALALTGFDATLDDLMIEEVQVKAQVDFGDALTWSMTLNSSSNEDMALLLDYRIDFLGARGQLRPKVFKWKKIVLKAGASVQLKGQFKFKPITTRAYYDGTQRFEVVINGQAQGVHDFELTGCP